MKTDKPLVVAIAVLYAGLVVAVAPPQDHARLLISALALLGLAAVVDRAWRAKQTPPMSIAVASIIAAGVLVVPAFRAMGGQNGPALPVGFIGVTVVTMWWVALRWDTTPRHQRTRLAEVLKAAMLAAIALSVIASVGIVIGLVTDRSVGVRLMLVYPGYFIGAGAAALVFWLLQGAVHRPLGKYLVGALAGVCLYVAVSPVVYIVKQQPIVVGELFGLGAVCGVLVGPPVAFGLFPASRQKLRKARRPRAASRGR